MNEKPTKKKTPDLGFPMEYGLGVLLPRILNSIPISSHPCALHYVTTLQSLPAVPAVIERLEILLFLTVEKAVPINSPFYQAAQSGHQQIRAVCITTTILIIALVSRFAVNGTKMILQQ